MRARLHAQLLAGRPAHSPEHVVERLLAVQGQDPRGFRLSVRSRSTGLTAADVDAALTDRRALIVTWVNRGTLHLIRADDYWWLHPLTTPQLVAGNQRRLREEGVGPLQATRGVDVVIEAVAEGPQTRAALRERLDAVRVPTARQALVHVLLAATLGGHVVRGPVVGGKEQAFVAVETWLGPRPPVLEREMALAQLARRYLAGHGPASPQDLVKWAGVNLSDARRAFDAVSDEVEPVGDGLVRLGGSGGGSGRTTAPPRLLGPFDPLLHGWASREPVVGPHAGVVTTNGVFKPSILVDGRVVGTWTMPTGTVTIQPLEPIPPRAMKALHADAADVLRFLGLAPKPLVIAATPPTS
jgi:hypothetical protein